MGFFDASLAKSNFKTALKWMTVGAIQSPYALYRSEIGTVRGDGTRHLTPYEMRPSWPTRTPAPRPARSCWRRPSSGDLGDPVRRRPHDAGDQPGQAGGAALLRAYLDYATFTSLQKPNISNFGRFSSPTWSRRPRRSSTTWSQTQGGGLKELLTAQTTNPSRALAAYYAGGNAAGVPHAVIRLRVGHAAGGARRRGAGAGLVPVDARRRRIQSSPTKRGPVRRSTSCSASRS